MKERAYEVYFELQEKIKQLESNISKLRKTKIIEKDLASSMVEVIEMQIDTIQVCQKIIKDKFKLLFNQ